MTTEMIIELVGYLGSLIVLVSFLMSSVVRLRIVNAVGGLIFAIYAIIIHSYPTALMNFCLIGINIYYLIRLTRSTRHYSLLEGNLLDAYLQYFLQYYREDIRVYFPEAPLHQPEKKGTEPIWYALTRFLWDFCWAKVRRREPWRSVWITARLNTGTALWAPIYMINFRPRESKGLPFPFRLKTMRGT